MAAEKRSSSACPPMARCPPRAHSSATTARTNLSLTRHRAQLGHRQQRGLRRVRSVRHRRQSVQHVARARQEALQPDRHRQADRPRRAVHQPLDVLRAAPASANAVINDRGHRVEAREAWTLIGAAIDDEAPQADRHGLRDRHAAHGRDVRRGREAPGVGRGARTRTGAPPTPQRRSPTFAGRDGLRQRGSQARHASRALHPAGTAALNAAIRARTRRLGREDGGRRDRGRAVRGRRPCSASASRRRSDRRSRQARRHDATVYDQRAGSQRTSFLTTYGIRPTAVIEPVALPARGRLRAASQISRHARRGRRRRRQRASPTATPSSRR